MISVRMDFSDFHRTHWAVWDTGSTCSVPTSSPRCRSSPPGWSARAAACCCTANGTGEGHSGEEAASGRGACVCARTACLGVVSWKQRPLGLSLEGIWCGHALCGGLISDWSGGWMTTEVPGVWWTRRLICTERRDRRQRGTQVCFNLLSFDLNNNKIVFLSETTMIHLF